MKNSGTIFNIQRYTIHDGPGIRTEIFVKGCPLKCIWCSNPESQNCNIELGIYKSKCIGLKNCGLCKLAKDGKCIDFYRNKITSIDREKELDCIQIAAQCPSEAIKLWGEKVTVEQCMEIIKKDVGYYERSGGGVTISGGEPFSQPEFTLNLLKACKKEGIHTCLETTLFAQWSQVEKVLPYVDLLISDIKHMDPKVHAKYTGVDNKLILENIEKVVRAGKDIILRIPVIPGINDNMDNMKNTADFIIEKLDGKIATLQLLSFMRLGEEKYKSLERPYQMETVKVNRRSFQKQIREIAEYFNVRDIHCIVGTKEAE